MQGSLISDTDLVTCEVTVNNGLVFQLNFW